MNANSPTRILGLSKNQPTMSLLKSLPRLKAEPGPKARLLKVPESIYAPPLSSDSEEDADTKFKVGHVNNELDGDQELRPKSGTQPSLSDSSDVEEPRGNITRTKFTSSINTNGVQSRQTRYQTGKTRSMASEARQPAESQPNKRRRLSDASDGEISSTVSVGRDSVPPDGSANHLKTQFGFTRGVKAKAKYGGKKTAFSQESQQTKATVEDTPKFRPPPDDDDDSSPQKPKNSKILVPGNKIGASPSRGGRSRRLNLQHHESPGAEDDDDLSSPKTKRSLIAPKSLVISPQAKPKPRPKTKPNPLRPNKRNLDRKPQQKAPKSQSPPPAKFQIPVQVSDFKARETSDDDLKDEPLPDAASEADSEEFPSATTGLDEEVKLSPDEASCPWCEAPVDKKFLQEFSKGKRLGVRMQSKFCQAHKKQTAMRTWESKQYPQVEWDDLEERFKNHRELMLGIINGDSSHYRTILASKIELGQARLMKKEGSLSPGYYGGRGFNLMCDYFVGEFGDLLKEKAVNDKVIAGRGSAAFIQSVLVAELGVQLIKEDLGVSDESARDIMEESKLLGDIIHGET